MIQVNVSNPATGLSFSGTFADSGAANAWVAQQETNGSWGLPLASAVAASYTGTPMNCSTQITITANNTGRAGNITIPVDGTSTVSQLIAAWNSANPSNHVTLTSGDGSQIPITVVIYLTGGIDAYNGYSVSQVDVTAQVALQASIQKGLQCQNFGATIIAQVYAYNEANLTSGALTTNQFNAMLADSTMANIERLLSNGSLNTALALINSYTTTLETYFSSAQVSAIVAAITNSNLI